MPAYKSILTSVGYHSVTAPLIRAAKGHLDRVGRRHFYRDQRGHLKVRGLGGANKASSVPSVHAYDVKKKVQDQTRTMGRRAYNKKTAYGRKNREAAAAAVRKARAASGRGSTSSPGGRRVGGSKILGAHVVGHKYGTHSTAQSQPWNKPRKHKPRKPQTVQQKTRGAYSKMTPKGQANRKKLADQIRAYRRAHPRP